MSNSYNVFHVKNESNIMHLRKVFNMEVCVMKMLILKLKAKRYLFTGGVNLCLGRGVGGICFFIFRGEMITIYCLTLGVRSYVEL